MAMQIENFGIECAALYRPLNNPFLNDLMEKLELEISVKYKLEKEELGLEKYSKI